MSKRVTTRIAPAFSLSARLTAAAPAERAALLSRLATVVSTLSDDAPSRRADLLARFEELLADADASSVWLALSVLDGELATPADVRRVVRAIRLDGAAAAFGSTPARAARNWVFARHWPEVRVVTDEVLVDLEHTARAGLATGIQRVARESARRWARDHDITLVAWGGEHRHLRPLLGQERVKALTGEGEVLVEGPPGVLLVPWRSTYLLPELSPERDRNERIAAIAQFAQGRTGVIGFDCVPVTTAETTALGVGEAFAHNLAAVRHMDRVSTISNAAAVEYRGWRAMLASTGRTGPEIVVDPLPAEVPETTPEDLAAVRSRYVVPGLPMVLCVGSHEPRKNHLALLHAAELLWREGVRFTLVLVGGRSWNDDRFQNALETARARNRPVQAVTGMSDQELWAAYRVARCTVFPSLNEGFGLPVAESLACGTPVVTSDFGSMAEIAADGGALLANPREDHSIAAALRTLLVDDAEHARLSEEARQRPTSSWDDYAARVWATLVTHEPIGG
jgi:glycosyltransferase involved in cell wall biosynthesis